MFGKLLPFLFVVQDNNKITNINRIPSTTWLSSVSEERDNDSSLKKVLKDIQLLYDDLSVDDYSKSFSPTIKFCHVRDPSITGSSSWRSREIHDDNDIDNYASIGNEHNFTKPVAIYLPGLDGTGISATSQFDDLAQTFELWRMVIEKEDQTSFTQLSNMVINFLKEITLVQRNRNIILIGESFGGLLAPSVALRAVKSFAGDGLNNPLSGLILVNPATSYDETKWSYIAPLLTSLRFLEGEEETFFPTPYSVVGGMTLATTIPDMTQLQQIIPIFLNGGTLENLSDGFGILTDKLPAATLEFRLSRWLSVGAAVVNPRLKSLNIPTLVIAGENDNLLPSKAEAQRLVEVMPNCSKIIVRGSGHFVLDDRVNLTESIINSPINILSRKKYDPILDWERPSKKVIEEVIEKQVKPIRTATSPVFFSSDSNGRRSKGLGQLPSESKGPLLFVANHQFFGIDLSMIIAELLEKREILPRGLAHPIIFMPESKQGAGNSENTLEKFGAVQVNPRNYYRLMETGQNALLFPGGVREVFHGKNEAYQLFWPDKTDFVRIAAKFNATIVPLSAVGGADSVNILVDAPDMVKLPFGLGDRYANFSQNVVSARFDTPNEDELFQPPFALPKLSPARHYFVFGKSFDTDSINYRDKEQCNTLYLNVKTELERGFDDILLARKHDPFIETPKRLAYEQLSGKIAPTFPINELNLK